MNSPATSDHTNGLEIAIIGMVGRFPGAGSIDQFWHNLKHGVESVLFAADQERDSPGRDNIARNDDHYVRSGGVLEGIELFDAPFFGFTPGEVETMDPQQRVFLECAWEALEHAGYDSERFKGAIGVYAGSNMNTYLLNLYSSYASAAPLDELQALLGNDKDYMASRVSYKANLRGPSVCVQTACSTSLVAVHLACRGLLSGECDLALAGGVCVAVPQNVGYVYQEGGLRSPDGRCRAFDAAAQGTIFSNGIGIVVLKRLADALADGDTIHAVVKGSAINNDGALKVGYTAPGLEGQEQVVRAAHAVTGVALETITYVEAHGTGTPLGDPVEIAALTRAFRAGTQRRGFCAIGSVKTNIGHLNTAAGVAGLIKTTLALKHRQIPPSLHFETPNPNIDFASSPFYVNTKLSEWRVDGAPRRAGVSSFGVGGTNAHVVLEEAPALAPTTASRPWQLLLLATKTRSALDAATANLHAHIGSHPDLDLADLAYTLQVGRRAFSHRRALVCRDRDDALAALETLDPQRVFSAYQEPAERPVVFMFPGGGAQYVNMALGLYEAEPVFREQIDLCAELLNPYLECDLRELIYPDDQGSGVSETRRQGDKETRSQEPGVRSQESNVGERQTQNSKLKTQNFRGLRRTSTALPALFAVEYALARLWMSWGVQPQALIGHSLGEYVAACLSGVLSLEDALALVIVRGRLFEQLPSGSMLGVTLPEAEVRALLNERLSVAAINGPSQFVVSGPADAIDELATLLDEKKVEFRRLQIDVAAHSHLVTPILESFTQFVEQLDLHEPRIPYISNVSGTWITAAQATDPGYWVRHLRQTVRFGDGIRELLKDSAQVLLEVGPGHTLSTLAKLQAEGERAQAVLASIRHPYDRQPDEAFLLATLGKLWLLGGAIDWEGFSARERRRRVPLPTYPFERQRYWIERKEPDGGAATRRTRPVKNPDLADWFSIPSWKRSAPPKPWAPDDFAGRRRRWLVFVDAPGLGLELLRRLEAAGQDAVGVMIGERFAPIAPAVYTIDPRQRGDYDRLLAACGVADRGLDAIIHLWSVTPDSATRSGPARFQEAQQRGFYSLLFLAQALAAQGLTAPLQVWVVSSNSQQVESADVTYPEQATIAAPCKVIPQEYENIACHSIDVVATEPGSARAERLIGQLLAEIGASAPDRAVAYRGAQRWVQTFEATRLGDTPPVRPLRENGVYLITGGSGGIGLLLAEYLARKVRARLVLVARSAIPGPGERETWLAAHGDEDRLSYAVRRVQALENQGTEVLTISADVADEAQMRAALDQARERFGAIHGVIHTAGIADREAFKLIAETGRAECEAHFGAKVYGLYVLETVLRGQEFDFCLLFSSNASVLGGLGSAGYTAANLFMDAFAGCRHSADDTRWISASWDGWLLSGDHVAAAPIQTSMDQYAMTPDESVEAFRRVVTSATVGHVIVSAGDLAGRLELWVGRERARVAERSRDDGAAPAFHARPALRTDYAVPNNEVERTIVAIWQDILGIEQIGIHDNFFELGGNSLLASRAVARIRDAFEVDFALRTFFETLTIAEMAQAITQAADDQEDEQDLEMLQMVEQLLDEEVDAALISRIESIKTGD